MKNSTPPHGDHNLPREQKQDPNGCQPPIPMFSFFRTLTGPIKLAKSNRTAEGHLKFVVEIIESQLD